MKAVSGRGLRTSALFAPPCLGVAGARDDLFQRPEVNGLDQVRIKPGGARTLDVVGLAVAGDGDEPDAAALARMRRATP